MDEVLEREFVNSWNHMEWFFGSGETWRKMPDMVEFIAMLRQSGYAGKLRAGQSLNTFVVSRSREHGLRVEQPRLGFHLYEGKMTVQSWGLQPETFVRKRRQTVQSCTGFARQTLESTNHIICDAEVPLNLTIGDKSLYHSLRATGSLFATVDRHGNGPCYIPIPKWFSERRCSFAGS